MLDEEPTLRRKFGADYEEYAGTCRDGYLVTIRGIRDAVRRFTDPASAGQAFRNQSRSSFRPLPIELADAVCIRHGIRSWYYAGQLRFRVYLLVNKDKLEPSGDPAPFAPLSEEIARPINECAFGGIPQLAEAIEHRKIMLLGANEKLVAQLTSRQKLYDSKGREKLGAKRYPSNERGGRPRTSSGS